jgi:hypothetical protein
LHRQLAAPVIETSVLQLYCRKLVQTPLIFR